MGIHKRFIVMIQIMFLLCLIDLFRSLRQGWVQSFTEYYGDVPMRLASPHHIYKATNAAPSAQLKIFIATVQHLNRICGTYFFFIQNPKQPVSTQLNLQRYRHEERKTGKNYTVQLADKKVCSFLWIGEKLYYFFFFACSVCWRFSSPCCYSKSHQRGNRIYSISFR